MEGVSTIGVELVKMISVFAAAFSIAFGAIAAASAMGKIGSSALESIARQPEISGKAFTTMLIAMALVEALAIYCLLISLVTIFANPLV
jgi:F-type H+-transporting ATPase subunit c